MTNKKKQSSSSSKKNEKKQKETIKNQAPIEDQQQQKSQTHLPQQLIFTQILTKLPVKSLIRFKLVSKQWNAHIASPQFAKSHLRSSLSNPSSESRSFFYIQLFKSSRSLNYPVHDRASNYHFRVRSLSGFDNFRFDDWTSFLIGSCDGMVCIGRHHRDFCHGLHASDFVDYEFFLHNPSTRVYKQVDSPLEGFRGPLTVGFGYVSSFNDYRVVLACIMNLSSKRLVYVYSLNSGKWRRLEFELVVSFARAFGRGELVNDTLHWVMDRSTRAKCIIGFDLVREKLIELNPPCSEGEFEICEMGGRLCAWEQIDGGVVLWRLERYGAWESWTRLFKLDVKAALRVNWVTYFRFLAAEKALIQVRSSDVLLVDLSKNPPKFVPLVVEGGDIDVFGYVESLVSPVMKSQTHLPQQLIFTQILTKLPVKSLIRFKLVSKQWNAHIASPQFAKSHLHSSLSNPSSESRSFFYIQLFKSSRSLNYPVHDRASNYHFRVRSLSGFDNFRFDDWTSFLIGSCDGMVCIGRHHRDFCHGLHASDFVDYEFFLHNPSTRVYKQVDSPLEGFRGPLTVGFGYVSSFNDYRVVLACIMNLSSKRLVYVYSLNSGKWRRLEFELVVSFARAFGRGELVNDTLHWVMDRSTRAKCIIGFDLVREKLIELNPPCSEGEFEICEMGGRLCAWEQIDGGVVLWRLERYGAWESWTRLFKLDVKAALRVNWVTYFRFLAAEKALIQVRSSDVLLVDLSKNPPKFVPLVVEGGDIDVFGYVESLVSPVMKSQTHLPQQLIFTQILTKLPVKSLIRFKLVSKQWNAHIASPQFAKSHLHSSLSNPSSESRSFFYIQLFKSSRSLNYPVHDRASNYHFRVRSLSGFDNFRFDDWTSFLIGSCDGMVCIGRHHRDFCHGLHASDFVDYEFFLHNPSTRVYKQVDSPLEGFRGPLTVGFGYVSSFNDYRVVLACIMNLSSKRLVYVYSLNSGKWRRLEFELVVSFARAFGRGELVNDTLHWVMDRSTRAKCIIGFDLVREKLIELNPPCSEGEFEICEMGGRLCAWEQIDGGVVLWRLERYGAWESWTRLFKLDVKAALRVNWVTYFRFLAAEKALIQVRSSDVLLVDLSKNPPKFVPLVVEGGDIDVFGYVESLVSPVMKSQTHLPQQLIFTQILTKLPVKSLIRFKLVSKQWNAHIASPQFAKSHLHSSLSNPSSESRSFFYIQLFKSSRSLNYPVHDRASNYHFRVRSLSGFDNFRFDDWTSFLIGSCDGMVCIGRHHRDFCHGLHASDFVDYEFFLHNPSTRVYKQVDSPLEGFRGPLTVGFGYVSSFNDYRVVLACIMNLSSKRLVYVYSLNSGKWRRLEFELVVSFARAFGRGELVNDTLHWVMDRSTRAKCIIGFDLVREKLIELNPPCSEREFEICEMGGRLCAWEQIGGGVVLWRLERYGAWESWTRLFKLDVKAALRVNWVTYFRFLAAEKALIQVRSSDVLLVDLSKNPPKFVPLVVEGGDIDVFGYVESLVSPVMKCKKQKKKKKKKKGKERDQASNEEQQEEKSQLPQELIFTEILTRLPVKSLLRFKTVSKQWNSRISSTQFAKSHLHCSLSDPFSSARCFYITPFNSSPLLNYTAYDSVSNYTFNIRSLSGFDNFRFDDFTSFLIGSCDGLVAFGAHHADFCHGLHSSDFSDYNFYIHNPSTHSYIQVPSPLDGFKGPLTVGFGYVPSLDDYLLVLVCLSQRSSKALVYLYSFKSGEWRKLKFVLQIEFARAFGRGELVNETFHWVMTQRPGVKCIVGFDLVAEKFTEVPPPSLSMQFELCAMGSHLCTWEEIGGGVEVWMLEAYGIWESWTQLFKLDVRAALSVNWVTYFRFLAAQKLLIQTDSSDVMLVDLSQNSPTYVPLVVEPGDIDVLSCVESLVSPVGLGNPGSDE